MNEKYTIGGDYGTLSARAVLVRCSDGYIAAEAALEYPHAVMSRVLDATGEVLPPRFCTAGRAGLS